MACPPNSRDWWGCQSNAKRLTPSVWHFHGNWHLRKSPLYQIFKKNIKIKAERTNKSMFDMPRVQSRFLRDTSLPSKWWAILLSKQLHKTSALHHSSSQGLEGAGKKWCSLKKTAINLSLPEMCFLCTEVLTCSHCKAVPRQVLFCTNKWELVKPKASRCQIPNQAYELSRALIKCFYCRDVKAHRPTS